MERPLLNPNLNFKIFQKFCYLKEELVTFCEENGLQKTGSKEELTNRITHYLKTGEKLTQKRVYLKSSSSSISLDHVIGENFVCSERHRTFYKEEIGSSFSFSVSFQKWLKSHPEKTYRELIDAYYKIKQMKKEKKTLIDQQFEYNTYIRDFFEANKGKCLSDAICCWNYKKGKPGHHYYEASDLDVLK